MIPLRDIVPSRTAPIVTVTLIIVNALAFLFEAALPERERLGLLHTYGVVAATLDPPSLIASMFLHGGWFLFLGHMLYLWLFGENVEDRMGHGRFLVFYLACGVVAAAAQIAADPASTVPTVGASGAVAGVLGAYFVLFPRSRILTLVPRLFHWDLVELPAIYFLGIWLVMQLGSGLATRVRPRVGGFDLWAQAAGFAAGAALVFAFRRRERLRVDWWS